MKKPPHLNVIKDKNKHWCCGCDRDHPGPEEEAGWPGGSVPYPDKKGKKAEVRFLIATTPVWPSMLVLCSDCVVWLAEELERMKR